MVKYKVLLMPFEMAKLRALYEIVAPSVIYRSLMFLLFVSKFVVTVVHATNLLKPFLQIETIAIVLFPIWSIP